ncbi:hypothetical protein B0H19DRAFT_137045 [Mycena capillaripes]|nr:hypothetical protein B0H19DRAFT_137045 [Mycena capillaripes]
MALRATPNGTTSVERHELTVPCVILICILTCTRESSMVSPRPHHLHLAHGHAATAGSASREEAVVRPCSSYASGERSFFAPRVRCSIAVSSTPTPPDPAPLRSFSSRFSFQHTVSSC